MNRFRKWDWAALMTLDRLLKQEAEASQGALVTVGDFIDYQPSAFEGLRQATYTRNPDKGDAYGFYVELRTAFPLLDAPDPWAPRRAGPWDLGAPPYMSAVDEFFEKLFKEFPELGQRGFTAAGRVWEKKAFCALFLTDAEVEAAARNAREARLVKRIAEDLEELKSLTTMEGVVEPVGALLASFREITQGWEKGVRNPNRHGLASILLEAMVRTILKRPMVPFAGATPAPFTTLTQVIGGEEKEFTPVPLTLHRVEATTPERITERIAQLLVKDGEIWSLLGEMKRSKRVGKTRSTDNMRPLNTQRSEALKVLTPLFHRWCELPSNRHEPGVAVQCARALQPIVAEAQGHFRVGGMQIYLQVLFGENADGFREMIAP